MKIVWDRRRLTRALLVGMAALIALLLVPHSAVAAYHEIVLATFCGGTGCTEGNGAGAGLFRDAQGNLYGTAAGGGTAGGGTVYELSPNATGTGYTLKTLYNFCSLADCADGETPLASLIMDDAGRLYGTTGYGGAGQVIAGGGGTVFQLAPNADRTVWTETVLHSFCPEAGCLDGFNPSGSLLLDRAGNLYSTTYLGGSGPGDGYGGGTVFELSPNAQGTAWTEKILYSFCIQANCTDGMGPLANLIQDSDGNFYGTTGYGGSATSGTVFELMPNKSGATWTEKVLYSFCTDCGQHAVGPISGLITDAAGNLYGTSAGGGNTIGGGLVFELTPDATRTHWTETTLHTFCSQTYCIDGDRPAAALVMDATGNLFGTTFSGGVNGGYPNDGGGGGGTVFELTPNAAHTAWTETVIHSFCEEYYCSDGNTLVSTLVIDRLGNLYGTTTASHTQPGGTVFEFEHVP